MLSGRNGMVSTLLPVSNMIVEDIFYLLRSRVNKVLSRTGCSPGRRFSLHDKEQFIDHMF
jgi:hypothetical protein